MYPIHDAVSSSVEGRLTPVLANPVLPMYLYKQDGMVGLLVELYTKKPITDRTIQGFNMSSESRKDKTLYNIRPNTKVFESIFVIFVEQLLKATDQCSDPDQAVDSINSTVEDFIQFFSTKTGGLTDSRLKDILAQLSFIDNLLDSEVPFKAILNAWTGPFGGKAFRYPNSTQIHTKSISPRAKLLQIYSETELEGNQNALRLSILRLRFEKKPFANSQQILPLCQKIEKIAAEDPIDAEVWRLNLQALGLEAENPSYDRIHFLPLSWAHYEVVEDFPRITTTDLDSRISRVEYSIDIPSLKPFTSQSHFASGILGQ